MPAAAIALDQVGDEIGAVLRDWGLRCFRSARVGSRFFRELGSGRERAAWGVRCEASADLATSTNSIGRICGPHDADKFRAHLALGPHPSRFY